FGRLTRIDFEKTRALISAFGAILNTSDGERLVVGAHEVGAGPFTAPVVIDGVAVDKPARHRSFQERFACLRRDVPPPFRGPPVSVLIADGDADAALGGVAELEIGQCGSIGDQSERKRRQERKERKFWAHGCTGKRGMTVRRRITWTRPRLAGKP